MIILMLPMVLWLQRLLLEVQVVQPNLDGMLLDGGLNLIIMEEHMYISQLTLMTPTGPLSISVKVLRFVLSLKLQPRVKFRSWIILALKKQYLPTRLLLINGYVLSGILLTTLQLVRQKLSSSIQPVLLRLQRQ